jgi:hypothetical protein
MTTVMSNIGDVPAGIGDSATTGAVTANMSKATTLLGKACRRMYDAPMPLPHDTSAAAGRARASGWGRAARRVIPTAVTAQCNMAILDAYCVGPHWLIAALRWLVDDLLTIFRAIERRVSLAQHHMYPWRKL